MRLSKSFLNMPLTENDLATLRDAYAMLENPSLAVRLSSAVGMPVEAVTRELSKRAPDGVVDVVSKSTHKAIEFVMQSSVRTIRDEEQTPASPGLHKAAAITTGAVGGFFGLSTLVVELPVTTAIMFRSIVDIARAEGEAPSDPETLLNCMQVFAMGSGVSNQDDAAETSYYGVRLALGKALTDAMQYVANYGVGSASAPALVRLISAVAHRFGIVVTQKAMAQTMPVLGAVGGGLVNTIFISHFQDMARGHFVVRGLERKYGDETVQAAYRRLKSDNLPI
ncbi:MAG: EcsC family protein [Woeseiaceae bacterium]